MAKTNFQDPGSSEIRSTHISGIMEAVNKIEESLNMDTVAETDVVLPELFISEDDRYRIFQAPEGKRNWLNSPAPVIKKNGVVISTGFGIDYGGGAVVFDPPLTASDTVTASFTRTKNTSGFNAHLAETTTNAHLGKNIGLEDTEGHFTATEVEGALHELFTSVSNGKVEVATAITDMGQSASGSDTFSVLATKIRDISTDATASTGDILSGKTAYSGGSKITGSMPNRGAYNITPGTTNKAIPAGYHNGSGVVYGDPDLIASNIKKGVNIFGITGTVEEVVATSTGSTSRLYHCDYNADRIYELNPSTFAVINYTSSYGSEPSGIEGMGTRVFTCDGANSRVEELNPDTLAIINYVTSSTTGFSSPAGIGGMQNRLYATGNSTIDNKIYELNPDTFVKINEVEATTYYNAGIGGITNRLYKMETHDDRIEEINPDTLAVLNWTSAPGYGGGIGGTYNELFYCDHSNDTIYEININHPFTVIRQANSPSLLPSGIGGTKNFSSLTITSVIANAPSPLEITYLGVLYKPV